MERTEFWVRRYLRVAGMVWMLLMGAYLFRGASVDEALSKAFLWALVSSTIFTGTRYYNSRKGVACAMCQHTVDE